MKNTLITFYNEHCNADRILFGWVDKKDNKWYASFGECSDETSRLSKASAKKGGYATLKVALSKAWTEAHKKTAYVIGTADEYYSLPKTAGIGGFKFEELVSTRILNLPYSRRDTEFRYCGDLEWFNGEQVQLKLFNGTYCGELHMKHWK